MRRILLTLLVMSVLGGFLLILKDKPLPTLRDGDLIFQTSTSHQSSAILIATADLFTHMGIIKRVGDAVVVIEATGQVKETPLEEWIHRGVLKRFAIYRDRALTPVQAKYLITDTKIYYGKGYDPFFSFHNDAIYCSELPYLAYKKLGISIGKVQKLSELNFDNLLVKRLIKQRWQRHTECHKENFDFAACYDYILNQELITPASIAADPQFKKIYSNYPFN